jgi:hypothetical protein
MGDGSKWDPDKMLFKDLDLTDVNASDARRRPRKVQEAELPKLILEKEETISEIIAIFDPEESPEVRSSLEELISALEGHIAAAQAKIRELQEVGPDL